LTYSIAPSLMRPTAGAVAEAGKATLRHLSTAIGTLELFLPRLCVLLLLEDAVGEDAGGVLDSEEFAELIEQRQSEAGIAAQFDGDVSEGSLQTRYQAQQHRHNAGMTGGVSRTQAGGQQKARHRFVGAKFIQEVQALSAMRFET
jgi:hypothetical protein